MDTPADLSMARPSGSERVDPALQIEKGEIQYLFKTQQSTRDVRSLSQQPGQKGKEAMVAEKRSGKVAALNCSG